MSDDRRPKNSRYGACDTACLLAAAGIIRNRLKIAAAIQNARATLAPKRARCLSPEPTAMSRDLLSRGFKFVGTTMCYAFMQATGKDGLRVSFF